MAATRLGSLTRVYESRRNQTRKRTPLASLCDVHAWTCVCVFLRVAAAFHFSNIYLAALWPLRSGSRPPELQMYAN